MDELLGTESPDRNTETRSAAVDETSADYLGRWNQLVSTTNWEKGRIISEWRSTLQDAEAPQTEYSDEAWSRRVGNVSGQHVGRLRRTWEKFGEVHTQYSGLYWSHFQAAVDWVDAEMWLEGGVQNNWSVNQMRSQRWEALGALPDQKPREEDILVAELDEDAIPVGDPALDNPIASSNEVFEPDFGDEASSSPDASSEPTSSEPMSSETEDVASASTVELARPFEDLPKLPDDLASAVETMKLTILHHKTTDWQEISRDSVLQSLDALKELVVSPPEAYRC